MCVVCAADPGSNTGWTVKVGGLELACKLPPGSSFRKGIFHVGDESSFLRQKLQFWQNQLCRKLITLKARHNFACQLVMELSCTTASYSGASFTRLLTLYHSAPGYWHVYEVSFTV
jgi:hypothetical protein